MLMVGVGRRADRGLSACPVSKHAKGGTRICISAMDSVICEC